MKNVNEMEELEIKKLSLKVSIPMVIAMISISLYGIIDTMFVSNIGSDALTTISLAIPIVAIITAVGLGTSIGVNAILAKTLGEKNEDKVKKIILTGIALIFISWIAIIVCGILGLKPLLESFTENKEIHRLGYEYLSVICIFSIGSLYLILFEKILEAYGKTKSSMTIQVLGAIINLILDPILIFGLFDKPALGIKGAAISTVIGQIIGMIVGLIIILKNKIITWNDLNNIKIDRKVAKDIYRVGLPTMFLESTSSFISLILNKILFSFSESAVSVWGIYYQLQKFIFIIIYGLNYGMIPIIAYNWGARKKKRISQSLKFFLKLAIGITAISGLAFFIFSDQLISIFNISEEILNIGNIAFKILSCGFIFAGVSSVLSASFQAFGKGIYSLVISMCRKIIIVLPLIILLREMLGINAVWVSFTIAEILTMIVALTFYKKINREIITRI